MLRLETIVAALLIGAGCRDRSQRVEPSSAGDRAMLAEAIARSDTTYKPPSADAVQVTEITSRVVPGLHYSVGSYTIPDLTPTSRLQAIVAIRGGRRSLLQSPADWFAITRGWSPSSGDEAIGACFEMIEMLAAAHSDDRRELYPGKSTAAFGFEELAPYAKRLSPPHASKATDGEWLVDLWVAAPGPMLRLVCKFGAMGVTLRQLDSIPDAGLLKRS